MTSRGGFLGCFRKESTQAEPVFSEDAMLSTKWHVCPAFEVESPQASDQAFSITSQGLSRTSSKRPHEHSDLLLDGLELSITTIETSNHQKPRSGPSRTELANKIKGLKRALKENKENLLFRDQQLDLKQQEVDQLRAKLAEAEEHVQRVQDAALHKDQPLATAASAVSPPLQESSQCEPLNQIDHLQQVNATLKEQLAASRATSSLLLARELEEYQAMLNHLEAENQQQSSIMRAEIQHYKAMVSTLEAQAMHQQAQLQQELEACKHQVQQLQAELTQQQATSVQKVQKLQAMVNEISLEKAQLEEQLEREAEQFQGMLAKAEVDNAQVLERLETRLHEYQQLVEDLEAQKRQQAELLAEAVVRCEQADEETMRLQALVEQATNRDSETRATSATVGDSIMDGVDLEAALLKVVGEKVVLEGRLEEVQHSLMELQTAQPNCSTDSLPPMQPPQQTQEPDLLPQSSESSADDQGLLLVPAPHQAPPAADCQQPHNTNHLHHGTAAGQQPDAGGAAETMQFTPPDGEGFGSAPGTSCPKPKPLMTSIQRSREDHRAWLGQASDCLLQLEAMEAEMKATFAADRPRRRSISGGAARVSRSSIGSVNGGLELSQQASATLDSQPSWGSTASIDGSPSPLPASAHYTSRAPSPLRYPFTPPAHSIPTPTKSSIPMPNSSILPTPTTPTTIRSRTPPPTTRSTPAPSQSPLTRTKTAPHPTRTPTRTLPPARTTPPSSKIPSKLPTFAGPNKTSSQNTSRALQLGTKGTGQATRCASPGGGKSGPPPSRQSLGRSTSLPLTARGNV